jgi:hypothetical protein
MGPDRTGTGLTESAACVVGSWGLCFSCLSPLPIVAIRNLGANSSSMLLMPINWPFVADVSQSESHYNDPLYIIITIVLCIVPNCDNEQSK